MVVDNYRTEMTKFPVAMSISKRVGASTRSDPTTISTGRGQLRARTPLTIRAAPATADSTMSASEPNSIVATITTRANIAQPNSVRRVGVAVSIAPMLGVDRTLARSGVVDKVTVEPYL